MSVLNNWRSFPFKGKVTNVRCVSNVVLTGLVCFAPIIATAQAQPASWFQNLSNKQRKNITVDVRTLKASEIVPDEDPLAGMSMPKRELRLDQRLEDLRGKLQRLNYRTFRLVSSERKSMPMIRRETINLGNGHTLIVRPIGSDADTICLWLKWQDQTGSPILDTRVHVPRNESILTGTDHTLDSGLILAISVSED